MAETQTQTRGEIAATDVSALLRARNPLLWVVTREEARAEKLLFEAAAKANYVMHTWDIANGACEMNGKKTPNINAQAPEDMLEEIKNRSTAEGVKSRDVWVLRDLPPWLVGPIGMRPLRQLRNLARTLSAVPRDRAQAVIVLTTESKVPEELSGHATVIEWPLPDRMEIAGILDAAIDGLSPEMQVTARPVNGMRDAAIDAAVGLTAEEAAACYARSLVQYRVIDPVVVGKEKKRVIARERVLEWSDPLPGGLDAVGGLENLKAWLFARKGAYSAKARAYGLPLPKGLLLVGVPGCGKSLSAKAIATAFGVPLLRLDLGALQSKFVGESQANIRKAFRVIEAIGRCVVWLDEIEKALAGATQGASDGGVSSDALGAILSWMQERPGEAFVIATANDITKLPPELLRKGRFDEIFFVDLPNELERVAVLDAALRANNRAQVKIDREAVAMACKEFTGSEIAAIVPDALYSAFGDAEREITTQDLIEAARTVSPLAETAKEKIAALRAWQKGKARLASIPVAERELGAGRLLDIA